MFACPGKADGSIDRSELMSLLRAWGDFMKQKEVVGVLVVASREGETPVDDDDDEEEDDDDDDDDDAGAGGGRSFP